MNKANSIKELAEPTIEQLLAMTEFYALDERLDFYSSYFIGKKLRYNPVGEGGTEKTDPRPTYNFMTFDCQSFVDTIISLAISTTKKEFIQNISSLRYSGDHQRIAERNYFVLLQWIPNNISKGLLTDITKSIGTRRIISVRKQVKLKKWLGSYLTEEYPELQSSVSKLILKKLTKKPIRKIFNLIPLSALFYEKANPFERVINKSLFDKIPHGAVATFYFFDTEHMGIVIKKGASVLLRHVGTKNEVCEEPLERYLLTIHILSSCRGMKVLTLKYNNLR